MFPLARAGSRARLGNRPKLIVAAAVASMVLLLALLPTTTHASTDPNVTRLINAGDFEGAKKLESELFPDPELDLTSRAGLGRGTDPNTCPVPFPESLPPTDDCLKVSLDQSTGSLPREGYWCFTFWNTEGKKDLDSKTCTAYCIDKDHTIGGQHLMCIYDSYDLEALKASKARVTSTSPRTFLG